MTSDQITGQITSDNLLIITEFNSNYRIQINKDNKEYLKLEIMVIKMLYQSPVTLILVSDLIEWEVVYKIWEEDLMT